jgi:hypothetical protein
VWMSYPAVSGFAVVVTWAMLASVQAAGRPRRVAAGRAACR